MTESRKHPAIDGTINVLMAGVGGQGVLIASEALALAAMSDGLQAKQSEVHGVAQRGGSVVSHVRFGNRVHSPLIKCGDVDALYALEQLEALRYAHYVRPGGAIVMNDQAVKPIRMPDEPELEYPSNAATFLREKGFEVRMIPALQTAVDLGDKRCANVVLLGALASRLPLSDAAWQSALSERFPAAVVALNRRAFERGGELSPARA